MLLTVDHGKWLALALTLLVGMVLLIAAARGRSGRWRTAGIVLPLMACVLVALGMAGLSTGQREIVILLDFSPSARRMPWRDPAWVLDLARKRLGDHYNLVIVGFDGSRQERIARTSTNSSAERMSAEWHWSDSTGSTKGNAETDIDAALAWRTYDEERHPGRIPTPRWVISDGLFSAPAQMPAGMSVAWTILPPNAIDVAVTDLEVRSLSETTPGQFELLAQIRAANWTPATAAIPPLNVQVEVTRDDVTLLRQDIPLHLDPAAATARWISVGDQLSDAARTLPHHYKITAKLLDQPDRWPENDTGEIILPPREGLRTLVIGEHEPTYPHAAFIKTDRFTATAEQLAAEGWQVIVLNDVPAEKVGDDATTPLSSEAARQIERAVTGNGTGLLILGNGHAFGPGRYGENSTAGQILERLSPFYSHAPKGSGRRIIFLLDASASMNEAVTLAGRPATERKISWAAAGIQEAATRLPPGNSVTVIAFSNTSRVVFQGESSATIPDLSRALQQLSPAGETAPDSALESVAAALGKPSDPDNPPPLLILLTDGEIPQMNVLKWRSVIESARAKLVVIAPPVPASENSILRQLAAIPNATWSPSADPATWREELVEAVMTQIRGAVSHQPLHWTLFGATLTGDTTAWTHVWQKQGFSIPLAMGFSGEHPIIPLAGLSQRSLGKVAALAIGDDNSSTYLELIGHLTQKIAAPPGDPRFTASIKRLNARDWLLSVDGIGENGFLNLPSIQFLQAKLVDSHTTSTIRLAQTAPGHHEALLTADGAFVASILRQPSAALAARVQSPGVETTEWPATVATPFLPSAPDHTVLSPLPDDATQWNAPLGGKLNLAPACWLAAAIAALTALWLRR